ncbi:MAG TPA: orotidine-5'-phosphate decarboxylase [Candidatus Cloacimonadota bacterium]|nr:orotidine-5'-phosphate decarboxylase [Candidatus Cloacimonadota bacterium]
MARTASASFWHKYRARWLDKGSLVCVGLDPDLDKLPDCVKHSPNPIWEFNRSIIDATQEHACCYKPNLAFYLADGLRGLEALKKSIEYIPDAIPVILDCKVGDIGSTMQGYVNAFFDELKVDAITINPLMGSDVLEPLLKREIGFAFALALTSNPSAADFFTGAGMDKAVSQWMQSFPSQRLGAVVGATQTADLARMRSLLPDRVFLIPGVGAQGGDLKAVLQHAIASKANPDILINSSRGIIFASSKVDFAQAAAVEAQKLYLEIQSLLR